MKVYLDDKNSVYTELKEHLSIAKELKEDGLDILLTHETRKTVGQNFDRLIINLQHGRQAISEKLNPEIHSLVWGKKDRELLIARKDKPKTIHIVGCPLFRKLKPRQKHKGINIVYTPFSQGDFPINYQIRDELRRLRGVNIITKLVETYNIKDFDNSIATDSDTLIHLEIYSHILSIADLVVTPHEQTFALMAQYLDIPVVGLWENQLKIPSGVNIGKPSEGCKFSTIHDLVVTVENQLRNPKELRGERKRAAIDFGGADIKNPIEEIIETTKQLYSLWKP